MPKCGEVNFLCIELKISLLQKILMKLTQFFGCMHKIVHNLTLQNDILYCFSPLES